MIRHFIAVLLLVLSMPVGATPSDDVEITLQRLQGGWGGQPRYTVTVYGNGRVVFDTDHEPGPRKQLFGSDVLAFGLMFPGRHESFIERREVDELISAFGKVKFFELADTYGPHPPQVMEDSNINRLSIRIGNRRKSVLEEQGGQFGMPSDVTDLMDMVDRATSTHRWIRGNPGILADYMARSGRQNNADAIGRLILAHARNDQEMLRALVNAGVPLDQYDQFEFAGVIGPSLYRSAIIRGWTDVFIALQARIALAQVPRQTLVYAMATSGGCSLHITRQLVVLGINPATARGFNNQTAHEVAANSPQACPDSRESRLEALTQMGGV